MNNKLETLSYNGTDVVAYHKQNDGLYFNVTEVSKMFGKQPCRYFELNKTKDLLLKIQSCKIALLNKDKGGNLHFHQESEMQNCTTENQSLWKTTRGSNAGTWIHYDILLDYASWVSHDFMMWVHKSIVKMECSKVIEQIKAKAALPKPLTEYDYSLALCRLLSYCRIPCFSEYEINSMDITAKTRRYDMVVEMYGAKYVIELKKDMITTDDVMSIFSRHYVTGMEQIDSNAQLVIMSPNGIEDNALLLIGGLRDTTYQSLIDFSTNCDSYLNRYYTNKLMVHNIHRELYILYGDKYVKEL